MSLVTGGTDRLFKLWTMREGASADEGISGVKAAVWACAGAGRLREGKGLSGTPRCAAFSADGSTIAIGSSQIVTLWDTASCELQHTLSHLPPSYTVTHLGFVGERHAQPQLVACTAMYAHVWDLLTLNVAWTLRVPGITGMVFSPHLPSAFAVVSRTQQGKKRTKEARPHRQLPSPHLPPLVARARTAALRPRAHPFVHAWPYSYAGRGRL